MILDLVKFVVNFGINYNILVVAWYILHFMLGHCSYEWIIMLDNVGA